MKSSNNNNIEIDVEELLRENNRKAQKIIKNPDTVDKLLKRLEQKLKGVPKLGGYLKLVPQMAMLINSWIRREYNKAPIGTIAAIIGVLIYFVSPIDAIPDFIPGIGLLDDAAVAGSAFYLIKNDLEEYMAWRYNTGLDEEEFIIEAEAMLE